MDLVKEAKKSNKEAYISLVEKYSIIFYKVSRIYFTLDKEIYGSLESAILNAYHNITNIKTEKDFLSSTIKDLKNLCELKIKKNKSAYQEVDEETLLKNVKYRMYKTDSIVEKCMRSLNSDLKLPTLLYYYVNLDIKEISWITGFTKSDIKKKIALVEPQLYDILKEDANNVEDVTLFIKNKLLEKIVGIKRIDYGAYLIFQYKKSR